MDQHVFALILPLLPIKLLGTTKNNTGLSDLEIKYLVLKISIMVLGVASIFLVFILRLTLTVSFKKTKHASKD